MSDSFAAGKKAVGICDRCGWKLPLKELKPLTDQGKPLNTLVCKTCWEPEHPQDELGRNAVFDPQALRNPRPDTGLTQSREIQWGWNPIGGARGPLSDVTDNRLVARISTGTLTVVIT